MSRAREAAVLEATRVAVAAVAFGLITYILSLALLCRRRCCNAWIGPARWVGASPRWALCDGRVVSRRWGRYACVLTVLVALCGACMTVVFFAHFPWTAQHRLDPSPSGCNYTAGISEFVTPCTMSHQVFWVSISSYSVFLAVVLLLAWGAQLVCAPLVCCGCRTMYSIYVADDDFDSNQDAFLGLADDEPHVFQIHDPRRRYNAL